MYQTVDSLLSANKPTKGTAADLANLSLQFNVSLHQLEIAQRKAGAARLEQKEENEEQQPGKGSHSKLPGSKK